MKALLTQLDIDPPRWHDLDRLVQRLPETERPAFEALDLPELTRWAEICRVDVAASPTSVRAKTSKDDAALFVRMNNSTRALPEDEQTCYCASRWPGATT